ncbi:Alpha-1,3-arabinosyltransferase XAT3 [Sesamum angolense]|uniref:Alpha-1,3-arabinosyltransferase XAT3 n=1 Tax=Sesamum angolense TaxID=2727404 RepID=A0AAE2BS43_9LAMI|nr:Alpha-1,3-arabinosyltransferase XAT3 [Sesamum angolense]
MKPITYNLSSSWSDVYDINGDVRIHGISSTIFIASSQEDNSSSWTAKPYARKGDALAMERIKELTIKHQAIDTIPPCDQNFTIPGIVFSTGGYVGNHYHAFTDVLSLEAHKNVIVDPWDIGHHSIRNFSEILRSVYSLGRESLNHCQTCKTGPPRMIIVCRRKSRRLMNKHAVANIARTLGFEVVLRQMVWNVSLVAQLVNSFDVMVGVHGAGLTNMVFLPENAVVVQIVPLGLDYIARTCFQMPAENMKLRYLDYKVTLNESSLFGNNSLDKTAKKGFDDFRSVYLDHQDVNIDLGRFKRTLLRALELVRS